MSEFYKGPLKVVAEEKYKFSERTGEKIEFKNFWIRHDDGAESSPSVLLTSSEYSMPEDEAEYRAHLFAAAPEMYEALKSIGDNVADVIEQMQLGEWRDSHGHDVCLNESMLRFIETLNKALAVTNKARGEQ